MGFCIPRFWLLVSRSPACGISVRLPPTRRTSHPRTLDGAVSAPCQKRGVHADLQFHGKVNITGEPSLN